MGKISVILNIVKEEIQVLPHALDSVKNLAEEIVLVDMTSSTELREIASKYNAKVFKHERVPYVEVARNYGISKAGCEWILVLDPDEEVSSSLSKSLRRITENPEADYFRIPRKNIIFGKWIRHSRWWPDYNIRFFKKGFVSWSEIIHSVPTTQGIGVDLEANEESAIIHYHYETVEQYIERLNRYTTEHAKNLIKESYTFDWTDLIHKPFNEFLSRYFQGEGYKDGLHGLALSFLQGFSEFAMYLKVWQMEKFKTEHVDIEKVVNEMKETESDLHYWQSDALLKEVGGLKHRIKRKLKL